MLCSAHRLRIVVRDLHVDLRRRFDQFSLIQLLGRLHTPIEVFLRPSSRFTTKTDSALRIGNTIPSGTSSMRRSPVYRSYPRPAETRMCFPFLSTASSMPGHIEEVGVDSLEVAVSFTVFALFYDSLK